MAQGWDVLGTDTARVQDTGGAGHTRCRTQEVQDTGGAGHTRCRTHEVQNTPGCRTHRAVGIVTETTGAPALREGFSLGWIIRQ